MADNAREKKKTSLYVPSAERPVVPVHRIGKLARFGARQSVTQEAIRVERKSVAAWTAILSSGFGHTGEGNMARTNPDTSLRYDGCRSS
jgi:hypothetical protein